MSTVSTPASSPASASVATPMGNAENRKRLRSALLFGLIALAGVAVVLYAWKLPPFTTPVQSTENALVKGQVTIISPQVAGYVAQVLVQDFQQVRHGDVLVKIDDRIYTQRVAQAQAQLAAARANLANAAQQQRSAQAGITQAGAGLENAQAQSQKARADLHRIEDLVADGSLSLRERDQARAARAQAEAGTAQGQAALEIAHQNERSVKVGRAGLEAAVQSAEAVLQLARIDLDNTEIRAPRDGQLGQVSVRAGAYVSAGTQLTAVVPDRLWIMANMKETQMAHVAVGQPANIVVDALDKAHLTGRVQRISPATGSEFSVISADNATGNFVKIAQRIPIYIAIDPGQSIAARLRPGMSVVVSVDTGAAPEKQPVNTSGGVMP